MADMPEDTNGTRVPGWDELIDRLRDLPTRMLAKLPVDQQQDPQIQQEIGRLALSAVASCSIDALGGDPAHPVFLPQISQVLNVGQPNADTAYRVARVAADGVYRLRGIRGSLRLFVISQSPPSPFEPGFSAERAVRTTHDFATLTADADDRFDVILSADRPDGHDGDWWKLEPRTNKLLMRMVSSDWAGERSPTISIERIDQPATRPRIAADVLEQRLRLLPAMIDFIGPMFVDHVEQLRQEGYVNALKIFDVSKMGGLTGQFYYEGTYEIGDDEALLLEAKVPEKYRYWSLILTNDIYETTDWYNNQSSLNDAQAVVDADGVLRIVVSREDPGVPNWLDTAGHARGLIQGRWTECDEEPIPSIRRLPIAALRDALPPGTPHVDLAQRDRDVRARRLALQHRPLW
jgi:hypothetical protein